VTVIASEAKQSSAREARKQKIIIHRDLRLDCFVARARNDGYAVTLASAPPDQLLQQSAASLTRG
jgi:hypothetical protein